MRRRNNVFALKKHEGHCSILRSNALFLRDKPVVTVCRLLNRNSKCISFTQRRALLFYTRDFTSVSYSLRIYFIFLMDGH